MTRNKRTSVECRQAFFGAAEKAGVMVTGQYVNTNTPVECVCPANHVTNPLPSNILQGRGWCRLCSGYSPITSEANFRYRAAQDGVTILGEYVLSSKGIRCICVEGHECYSTPNKIQQGGGWCRICAGLDKATVERSFLEKADRAGVIVLGEYVRAIDPIRCRCPEGHECYSTPNKIQQGGGWCRICSGKDSATAERNFRERALVDGVTLIGDYINAYTAVSGFCIEGHAINSVPGEVRRDGEFSCAACRILKDNLYVIYGLFEEKWWAKIGITSVPSRLYDHKRNGWEACLEWSNLKPGVAWSIESQIKKILEEMHLPHVDKHLMPQDGYTETFPIEYLPYVESMVEFHLNEFAP